MTGPERRVRVLWAIKQLGPGGSERLLAAAAGRHDHDRFAIDAVYLVEGNDELAPLLRASGVTVHCLGVRSGFDARWLPRLRALLRRGRYDVLHVHSPLIAGVARPLIASLPRAERPALVVTEHGAWHHYQLPTRMLNLATMPVGAAHYAVSASAKDSLPWLLRRRTDVLIHGVPVATVTPMAAARAEVREDLGVGPDDLLVLTVANLRPEKDYPTLLAAAAELVATEPALRFVAVGGGRLEGQLWGMQRALGIGARFQFLGHRDDAVRLMAGADIFVLPSREEGSPVAVAEAMAVGLPIIATRVGGVPLAVRDGVEGLIVAPGRPEALVAAIRRLAHDPDLRARLAEGARRRSADYDVGRTATALEARYLELAHTAS